MKLRNKKTGEIIDFASVNRDYDGANDIGVVEIGHERGETIPLYSYTSLAELNEEWEDVPEEPKEYWFLSGVGEVVYMKDDDSKFDRDHKFIGNYFETKEEAKKAVEKLKAWKRLKDNGFEFDEWGRDKEFRDGYIIKASDYHTCDDKDLDLLFGGEQ